MTKYTSKLNVNILTFRTEKKILNNCINSIDKSIPINIIENSMNFEHEAYFKKRRKNLNVFCTGNNFGYGKGHNYGFLKTKSRYVLICNPDVIFRKDYFKLVKEYLKKKIKFHIIGSQYHRNKMNRPAYGLFTLKKINPNIKKDVNGLQRVNWVVGCTMLFDLNNFSQAISVRLWSNTLTKFLSLSLLLFPFAGTMTDIFMQNLYNKKLIFAKIKLY